jgi:hypothetical protein
MPPRALVFRLIAALLLVAGLSACTRDAKWASDEEVARAHYVDPGPASITLFTSINTRNQSGAHAGLLINGSERVLYDPAGSWVQPAAPERMDLHYGMRPELLASYVTFQGTAPYEVTLQTVYVSREVADMAIAAAQSHGAANKAACTIAIATVLKDVPGFESLSTTYFPKALSRGFAELPGVQTVVRHSTDGALRAVLPGAPAAGL